MRRHNKTVRRPSFCIVYSGRVANIKTGEQGWDMLGTDAERLTLCYSTRVQWLMASLSGNLDGHAKDYVHKIFHCQSGTETAFLNMILLLVMRLCFHK